MYSFSEGGMMIRSKEWKNGYNQATRDIYYKLRWLGFEGIIEILKKNS